MECVDESAILTGLTPTAKMLDGLLSARPGNHFRGLSAPDEDDSIPDRGVNFPMFLTMMGERLFEFDSEAELVEAFECFDENDTGTVKVEEVRKWLGEVGDRMSGDEVCTIPVEPSMIHSLSNYLCRLTAY